MTSFDADALPVFFAHRWHPRSTGSPHPTCTTHTGAAPARAPCASATTATAAGTRCVERALSVCLLSARRNTCGKQVRVLKIPPSTASFVRVINRVRRQHRVYNICVYVRSGISSSVGRVQAPGVICTSFQVSHQLGNSSPRKNAHPANDLLPVEGMAREEGWCVNNSPPGTGCSWAGRIPLAVVEKYY